MSTDSLNFALAVCFTMATASSTVYAFVLSTFGSTAL